MRHCRSLITRRRCRLSLTPERSLKQLFLVKRQANAGILERFEVMVEVDEVPVQREPCLGLEFRIAFDFRYPVGWGVVDHVQFARTQIGQAHRRLGDLSRNHALEIGRPCPVIVEPLQFDFVAEFSANEFERPRPDRCFSLLVHTALRHHRAGAVLGKSAKERSIDP